MGKEREKGREGEGVVLDIGQFLIMREGTCSDK